MQAVILSIGDELMLGQTQDTNASWLSQKLAELGITLQQRITIGDDVKVIAQKLREVCSKVEVVLVTGGLGPTDDDLTRHSLAQVLDKPLELDEKSLNNMKRFFANRQIEMPETNRIQAMIPTTCRAIANHQGTAPGIQAKVEKTRLYFMPGVPSEMKAMFSKYVAGAIKEQLETVTGSKREDIQITVCRKLHTFGTGESKIAEMLGDMLQRHRNPLVNSTPAHGIVSLRINARAADKQQASQLIQPVEREIRQRLGDLIFGSDDDTLAGVTSALLRKQGFTTAVAESCTGGLLAKEITDIPGASEYFRCGWITYSNQAKTDLLGVSEQTLTKYGAVSEQVATQMAVGALELSNADFALATTGIAGPTGATADKPVGLVYIALAGKINGQEQLQYQVQRNVFHGNREQVRRRAVNTALNMLRLRLIQNVHKKLQKVSDIDDIKGRKSYNM